MGSLSAEFSVLVPTTGGTAINTIYGANSEQRKLFKHYKGKFNFNVEIHVSFCPALSRLIFCQIFSTSSCVYISFVQNLVCLRSDRFNLLSDKVKWDKKKLMQGEPWMRVRGKNQLWIEFLLSAVGNNTYLLHRISHSFLWEALLVQFKICSWENFFPIPVVPHQVMAFFLVI